MPVPCHETHHTLRTQSHKRRLFQLFDSLKECAFCHLTNPACRWAALGPASQSPTEPSAFPVPKEGRSAAAAAEAAGGGGGGGGAGPAEGGGSRLRAANDDAGKSKQPKWFKR